MRITQSMIALRTTSDLARTQESVARHQREISTGQRINKPSDDALGTRDALRRREELAALDSFSGATADATGWLNTGDTALGQVTDVLQRARELTAQGANGIVNSADRQRIATELEGLIASAKDAANARYGDNYIFAGHQTQTAPYAAGTADAYTGDSGVVARQIGPGVSVAVNVTAGSLFGSGSGDGKLIDVLRTVQARLAANDQTGLSSSLAAIDGQLDAVGAARATLGATQNRVDAAGYRLQDAAQTATQLLSDVEGVDLAQALTALSTQQTAYTAALKASASVMQTSLLDFLR